TSLENKKQEYVKSDDKKEEKKVDEKKRDMSKVKCYNYKKEDSEASSSSSDDKINENDDLLARTKALQEQIKVKHVVIDNHVECQAKYVKLEAERFEYMIRYSAYFNNDKQHRKQIADQDILFDKMSHHFVELDENVRMLKNIILEKDVRNKMLQGIPTASYDDPTASALCHCHILYMTPCPIKGVLRAHRSQDSGKRERYKQGPKEEEAAPKALMELDGIRVIWLMGKKTMLL
nr:hypothetical protein [Tanacetum cinerariifolium]